MKTIFAVLVLVLISIEGFSQSSADSVTITFRAYEAASTTMFLPGEFNYWGHNSGGVISSSDTSKMLTYNSSMSCWTKTYRFKIKAPTDTTRHLGDSVYQYKIKKGAGTSTGWYADPLNTEVNSADQNNSVLRMTKLFWFEYNQVLSGSNITRLTAGLIRANSDTITSITFSTGAFATSTLTTVDLTSAYNATTRIFDATLATPVLKANYIRLVAYNNHGDSAVYAKGGYGWFYQPMPAYVKHGVTLPSVASNDSTSFRLRVTNKDYVLLRIAPAGQPVSTATPIVLNHNSTDIDNWWINVKLDPGTYEYVYEIENGKQIHDPWGRYIGSYGTRFTIGAEGLTADNYQWNSTWYQRPSLNKLIIYEMNIMEFAGGYFGLSAGQVRWSHMISLLPYLDSLGINAIELMPVTDYGGIGVTGFSWGYDVNSYFALEPTFGPPQDFKEFVDSAHSRGIAVIMDAVYNHLNETSSLWQMQADEYANPYFKYGTDLRPNEDNLLFFKDLDHWTIQTQELVYTSLKMWIDEYHIDGFRYDYTQGIGWSRFDTTKGVLGWANKIANEYNNSIYQIAEHLPESPALVYYSGLTGGWHGNFREKIFNETDNQNTSLTDFQNIILDLGTTGGNDTPSTPTSFANRTEPVNDCSNHDEQSLFYEMIHYKHVDTTTAIQRDKLYATFMFTSLGIPMLWEGIEFSAPRGFESSTKLNYRPLEWNVYRTARGQSHYAYYHSLIMQRKKNPALYAGQLVKQYAYTERVLVWGFKDSVSGAQVQIIANLSSVSRTVFNVPWLSAGTWYDVFDQSTFIAPSTHLESYTLPAYTARVFSNKTNYDLGILGVEDTPSPLPTHIVLAQNFPNPFNPSTNLHFELPARSLVTLKVYDLMGREIATLVDGDRSAGVYDIPWNANNVPSGVYFYRLTTEHGTQTKKLMIIR